MKKNLLICLLPLALVGLTGCKPPVDNSKVYLEYGKVHNVKQTKLEQIAYDELKALVEDHRTFALAVSNDGCTCWTGFQPILANFNYKYNLDIAHIDVRELSNASERFGIFVGKADSPYFLFFKEGKLIRQAIYGGNNAYSEIFTSESKFEKYFFENAYLPKMLYVEKNTLDTYISENKEFNLYVARKTCGDCQAANREVLSKWNTTVATIENPLYIFDIDIYRGTEEYQTIKDTYGLSEVNNPDYGWSTGFVPAFQHRKGSTIEDMCVVLNDGVREENDKKVLDSYYTSERVAKLNFLKGTGTTYVLDGMELNENQYTYYEGYGYFLKAEVKSELHNPILKLFIDEYVK